MPELTPRRAGLISALLLLTGSAACGATDKGALADQYLPRLERILTENIAPFWYDKSIDREHGGYIIDFDAQGRRKSRCTKMIVTQARTVWLFSRMARAGYRRDDYLAAADVGFQFLKDRMWDAANGGFYWEVDVTGDQQLKPNKHLYGQSFALYALSEYYLASGKQEVAASRFLFSPTLSSTSTCMCSRPSCMSFTASSIPLRRLSVMALMSWVD